MRFTSLKKWLCLCVVLLVVCGNLHAKLKNTSTQVFAQKFLTEWMQANGVPGLAVVIYENEHFYRYYLGIANLSSQEPVTKKTIFEIGSLTELYTGVLLAEQLLNEQVKLAGSLADYVPGLVAQAPTSPFSSITLMQLATQTSGLPAAIPQDVSSKVALASYFSRWKPAAPIGSRWQNSGINFGLLGFVLEAVTQQNYNLLLRAQLLGPLKMQDIGVFVPTGSVNDVAQGYDAQGQAVNINTQEKLFPAAIDVKMSVEDMEKFLALALGLTSEVPASLLKSVRIAQTPFAINGADVLLGLGWEIYSLTRENTGHLLYGANESGVESLSAQPLEKFAQKFDDKALMEKVGVTAGFSAYIGVIPHHKAGIVLFANRALPTNEIARLGRTILVNIIETPKT